MAFTYQPLSDDAEIAAIGRVRLLATDTIAESALLQDSDIQAFLLLEENVIKLAAAQALDFIASREVLVQKRIETLGLKTDGPAESKELRAHANALRAQVKAGNDRLDELAEAELDDFDIVPGADDDGFCWL